MNMKRVLTRGGIYPVQIGSSKPVAEIAAGPAHPPLLYGIPFGPLFLPKAHVWRDLCTHAHICKLIGKVSVYHHCSKIIYLG